MEYGPGLAWVKGALLDEGIHWRHLANAIEPSMCGGDAAFLPNYFDHLFMCAMFLRFEGIFSTFRLKILFKWSADDEISYDKHLGKAAAK